MSEIKVNKVSPRSGTTVTLGDSGDTFTVPAGATLDTSGATVVLPALDDQELNNPTVTNYVETVVAIGTVTTSNTISLTNGTATFTSVKFPASGAPTITATAGKMDILTFVADGTNWYGSYTQGYTP